jgi:hypothetical protein
LNVDRRFGIFVVSALLACSPGSVASAAANPKPAAPPIDRTLPGIIQRFTADQDSLRAVYTIPFEPSTMARFEMFYNGELTMLSGIGFEGLSQEDRVDYLLLKAHLRHDLHQLAMERQQAAEVTPLLPYAATVEQLVDRKRLMQRPDAEKSAAELSQMVKQISALELKLDPKTAPAGSAKVNPVVANRAVQASMALQSQLHLWFDNYNGYDPIFTWWVDMPYKAADKAITDHISFLKQKLVGIAPEDKTTIIGDPVGRPAIVDALADNLIPYTPEELIAIAQTEYDWCMVQMLKASHEMGYGDDWHAAVEKVKQTHVPPGEQPEVIRKLVQEGSDFVKKHDLVTVPPLADETWHMVMMTPEQQLVNPFFTGGDEISVSYPTNTMTFEQRQMSMRGNATPLSHATAFHEMIPGHYLQTYISARYNTYRNEFETPFWHEGNSLWWEMLLWDEGFDKTPEDRVGALVWRMHRSARVIFSMNFHLGHWTPQQCVQFLIDKVGFEPDNATAEVRRSFDGSVGPLYQSAYLIGGLQFRALHHELVDSGKMTNRKFHDRILHENSMPIELLRADMEGGKLTEDFTSGWKFYGDHPVHP